MKSWVSSHFRYIIIYLPETFQRFPNIISIIGQIFPILFYINVQFQRGSIWSAPGHRARMRSRHVSHSILWCHSRSLRPLAAPGPRTRSNSGDFRLWSMEVKHPNISYLFISHIPIDWGNGLTLGSSFQMFPGRTHLSSWKNSISNQLSTAKKIAHPARVWPEKGDAFSTTLY